MADQECVAILLWLISSIPIILEISPSKIAIHSWSAILKRYTIQQHVTMLNVHGEYMRKRMDIMKIVSDSTSQKSF